MQILPPTFHSNRFDDLDSYQVADLIAYTNIRQQEEDELLNARLS